jgi:hypothetical protein
MIFHFIIKIMFDGLLEHCSVPQTDEKIRVNIKE